MIKKFISSFKPKKILDLQPLNFKIYTFHAGYKKNKEDLLIIVFEEPVQMSALYTKSSTPAAPVIWAKKNNNKNICKVLIVNSGIANAFTGFKGIVSIKKYTLAASKIFNCKLSHVLVSSTGIIGEQLDPNPIIKKLESIKLARTKKLVDASKAIMTTDTYVKTDIIKIKINNQTIRIFGIAKGSGMIAPNMGTMLSYIFVEFPLSSKTLSKLLKKHIGDSFNSISVDSDTSTNDTVMIFATGHNCIKSNKISNEIFNLLSQGIRKLMINLAKQIVCDGEGISKLIEINVKNAKHKNQALKIAFSIAESPLVKSAICGQDPNWGRVIMAIGKTFEKIDQNKLILKFGDQIVAKNGMAIKKINSIKLNNYMKNKIIKINLDLGLGKYNKIVWSSDLTKKYVEINSDYST